MGNGDVSKQISAYPESAQRALNRLIEWIYELVESNNLGQVEENLKWGEPSFSVKSGSPIRMDWKQQSPDHYCLYFNCNTRLVETFRELYSDVLTFEGNRAIVFSLADTVPESEVKHCLSLALQYKSLRHLPLLGA